MLELLRKEVLSLLSKYEGEKEIPPNKGFESAAFQLEMEAVGWKPDMQWCVLFAEMIWKKAYWNIYVKQYAAFDKLFSANSRQTLANFKKAGWTVSNKPEVGALCIWGGKGITGHTDIVFSCHPSKPKPFTTMGGNVGDSVKKRLKMLKSGDMVLLGFVYLKELDENVT